MIKIPLFIKNSKPSIKSLVLILGLMSSPRLNASSLEDFTIWKRLYEEESSFSELSSFIQTHPQWPSLKALRKKTEKALKDEGMENDNLLEWFSKFPPLTAEGCFVYIKILLNKGRTTKAREVAQKAWTELDFSPKLLKEFKEHFSVLISNEDNVKRVNNLLFTEEHQAVRDMLPYLTPPQQEIVQVRLSLSCKEPHPQNFFIAQKDQLERGLLYDLIKWYRRHNHYSEVFSLFKKVNKKDECQFAERWWQERNLLARDLLERKKYLEAIKIIEGHCLSSGEGYVHAEWMIGWLQLKFLKQPEKAYERFKKIYPILCSPQSKSRFAFWAGEALRILKRDQEAQGWYFKAAVFKNCFYGQLASCRLIKFYKKNISSVYFTKRSSPPSKVLEKFKKRTLVRVLKTMSAKDREKYIFFFLFKLVEQITDPIELELLISFAQEIGGPHAATELQREIGKHHYLLTTQTYPVLPSFFEKFLEQSFKKKSSLNSLAHAIVRQESNFNHKAESCAGAMGLMQLRPIVEKEHIPNLRKYGFSVKPQATLFDIKKNLTIGTVHLDQMLKKFGGHIPLATAAYNAGASNVEKWLSIFGDPRTQSIDWLTWIELIPFKETRNYVQRVMENYIVYQHRIQCFKRKPDDLEYILNNALSPLYSSFENP